MKIIVTPTWIRLLVLMTATSLSPCQLIGGTGSANHQSAVDQKPAVDLAPTVANVQADAQAKADQAKADAAIKKIKSDCHVSDTETDPKKINKQLDCVARAVAAQRRKIVTEKSLQSTINQVYGVPPVEGQPFVPAPANAGASSSDTGTTCGPGTGATNPLIRVHRLLMAPKNASDTYGYRLGKRYIVYQVTISNDSKDYQYLIHDVSLDISSLFFAEPGTYRFAASSQDLTLLRGIPEKGQDLDRRNLLLHVLQGIGSVAGGISGLTSFSDEMGSSVAVFNGPFLQAYVGIAPDHTGTQLNRLSDSAYITNTLVDKQRAKTIALFIPEATILSRADQKKYWKDPYTFLQEVNLNQADVCVDGAFIVAVQQAATLTSAVLTPKEPETQLHPAGHATLRVQGTNLSAGDTLVVGLGSTVTLSSATGTTGSVDVVLPRDYHEGMQVHLTSANSSATSATIRTTEAPTLTSAVLTPKTPRTQLHPGDRATLTVQGTNLIAGDTQVIGLDTTTYMLTTATGTTGSVDVVLPRNYHEGMQVHLASAANPNAISAPISTTSRPAP